jgi:hypothetical protein
MPAACAADLREELLARVWGPTLRAASRQDAELAADLAILEAAGALEPPVPEELCGPFTDSGMRTAKRSRWMAGGSATRAAGGIHGRHRRPAAPRAVRGRPPAPAADGRLRVRRWRSRR